MRKIKYEKCEGNNKKTEEKVEELADFAIEKKGMANNICSMGRIPKK